MSFNVFARGLHTRIAVARLPLRQLGFLKFSGICNGHFTANCLLSAKRTLEISQYFANIMDKSMASLFSLTVYTRDHQ